MSCKVGKVEFYAGPKSLGADDDLEDVIIRIINSATKSHEIAVQELEKEAITKAIIDAR